MNQNDFIKRRRSVHSPWNTTDEREQAAREPRFAERELVSFTSMNLDHY